jgi:hypothetical protein
MKLKSSSKDISLNHSDQDTKFKIINKIKHFFPTNKFYIFIFIFFKFLGILIITNNGIGLADSENSRLGNSLRGILYFKSIKDDLREYNKICLFIYAFILLSLILFYFLCKNLIKDLEKKKTLFLHVQKHQNNEENKNINILSPALKFIVCFLINLIILFSQHFVEILSLIYLDIFLGDSYRAMPTSNDDVSYGYEKISLFIIKLEDGLLMKNYIIGVINTFFILIINIICYFYLKFLNEPFISSESNMKYSPNKLFYIMFVILSNFSSVHYLDIIFPSSLNLKITLLILCLITLWIFQVSFANFLFYNFFNYFTIALASFCKFSIVLQFIIYINNQNGINLKTEILRIIFQLILTIFFTHFIFRYKKYKNFKNIPKILFHKTKVLSINSLYEVINLLKNGVKNRKYLNEIFLIIYEHKFFCKNAECACSYFEIDNFLSKLNIQSNSCTNNEIDIIIHFQKSYHELIVLFKNEILKAICNIHKKNKQMNFIDIENYLLLHIEFILYFRRKTQLCLYLKNRYKKNLQGTQNSPKKFMFNFYLNLLEVKILKLEKDFYFKRKEKNHLENRYLDVYFYINLLSRIQNLLIKNVENFESLVKFKHVYNNKILNGNYCQDKLKTSKIKTEHLLKTCKDINRDSQDLLMILTREFNESSLKNVELCFLLYNYFILLDKKIPCELESNFISVNDCYSLQQYETSFEEKGMKHPVIIKLSMKNFIISYISQKLCDNLGYKKAELLNQDFHKLLPTCFSEQHSLMIKKFLIYDRNFFFKKETFALTKNGYFFPLKIFLTVLPGLEESTFIMDMQPAHFDFFVKENNNFFVMVLDRKFKVVTINEEFEEKFCLNLEMMKKLDFDIFSLFGIQESQIKVEFSQHLEKIENYNYHWNNLVEIFKCADLKLLLKEEIEKNYVECQQKLSADLEIQKLQNSPYKNCSESKGPASTHPHHHSHKFGDNYLNSKIYFRRKMVMAPYLQKLQLTILENEHPKEWLDKTTEIEKAVNKINSPIRLTFIPGITPELKNAPNDLLKIEIQLRGIADSPYYLVRVWESEKSGIESPLLKSNTINRNIFRKILMKKKRNEEIKKIHEDILEENCESSASERSELTVYLNKNEKLENFEKSQILQTHDENTKLNSAKINFKNHKNIDHLSPYTNRSKLSRLSRPSSPTNPCSPSKKNSQSKKISLIKKISNKILNLLPMSRNSEKLKTANLNNNTSQFQILSDSKEETVNNLVQNQTTKNSIFSNFHHSEIASIASLKEISDTSSSIYNHNNNDPNSPQKRWKHKINIQKLSNKNKMRKSIINFLLLFLFLVILTSLSLYNIFFSSSRLESSYKLFKINFSAMGLKGVIVFCGAGILNACLKSGDLDSSSVDGYEIPLKEYQKKLRKRAQEMYVYVYDLKSYLQSSGEIPGMEEIHDIMNKNDIYYLMSENWEKYSRNSTFVDELDYYHYYVANLQNPGMWGKCQINNLGLVFNKPIPLSFGEKVTYYTIYNMMTKFRPNLLNLTTATSNLLNSYHESSKNELMIYNIVIVCVFISLGLSIVKFILYYRRKIYNILKKLFEIKIEDEIFEKKLLNFKSVLLCLDRSSCLKYEEKKVMIKKEVSQIKEKSKTIIGTVQNSTNLDNNYNNSTSNFLVNNSQQNHFSFLNSNLQKKLNIKSPIKQSEKSENEKEQEKCMNKFLNLKEKEKNLLSGNCESNSDSKQNFEYFFYISFVKTSLYIIIFFNLAYIILILVNIVTNINDYNTILFSNRVSINFMDRIPRLMDLILYYKISILLKDVNFITKPQSEYLSRSQFYNLFDIQANLEDDTIFSSLKNSEFNFILYMLQLERSTLKTFAEGNFPNVLPKTKLLENSFNTNEACVTLGMSTYYYTYNIDYPVSLDFRTWFTTISDASLECKKINKGMNLNGFFLAIDSHIASIVNLYIDFFRSSTKSPTYFLQDFNFLRAQMNVESSLKKYQNSILASLNPDIENLYSETKSKEFIFSALKVVLAFSFIVYFIYWILFSQNYVFHLKNGINKFRNAI